jgi:hypothetical protein
MPGIDAEFQMKWDLIKIGFGIVSGAAIPLVVERLRRWFYGPRLEVVHAEDESFMPTTEVPGRSPGRFPAKYLRVRVKNTGGMVAKGCRAYLVKIEEIIHGKPSPTFYRDTLRLRWAYEEQGELHEGVDIPPGIFMYFDVFSIKLQEGQNVTMLQVAKLRDRFVNKLELNKIYRFTILVAAEATGPVQISLKVKLGSSWNDFSVTDPKPLLVKGQKPDRET